LIDGVLDTNLRFINGVNDNGEKPRKDFPLVDETGDKLFNGKFFPGVNETSHEKENKA